MLFFSNLSSHSLTFMDPVCTSAELSSLALLIRNVQLLILRKLERPTYPSIGNDVYSSNLLTVRCPCVNGSWKRWKTKANEGNKAVRRCRSECLSCFACLSGLKWLVSSGIPRRFPHQVACSSAPSLLGDSHRILLDYRLNGTILSRLDSVTDLGVTVDAKLHVWIHCTPWCSLY